eukprot:RCo041392
MAEVNPPSSSEDVRSALQRRVLAMRLDGLLDAETYAGVARLWEMGSCGVPCTRKRRSQSTVTLPKEPPAALPLTRHASLCTKLPPGIAKAKPADLFARCLEFYLKGSKVEVEKRWAALFAHHQRVNTVMTAFYVAVAGLILYVEWDWKRLDSILHIINQIELILKTSHTVPVPRFKDTFVALLACLHYREAPRCGAQDSRRYSGFPQVAHDVVLLQLGGWVSAPADMVAAPPLGVEELPLLSQC